MFELAKKSLKRVIEWVFPVSPSIPAVKKKRRDFGRETELMQLIVCFSRQSRWSAEVRDWDAADKYSDMEDACWEELMGGPRHSQKWGTTMRNSEISDRWSKDYWLKNEENRPTYENFEKTLLAEYGQKAMDHYNRI